jgi:hypothetical protein
MDDLRAAADRYRQAYEKRAAFAQPSGRHTLDVNLNRAEADLLALARQAPPASADEPTLYEMTREALTAIRQIASDLANPRVNVDIPERIDPPAEPQNLAYLVHSNYRCTACGARMTKGEDYYKVEGTLGPYAHREPCYGRVVFIGPLDVAAGERR